MSIEQQLADLTVAIDKLTAAVLVTIPKGAIQEQKPAEKPTKTAKPAPADTQPTAPAAAAPEQKAEPSAETPASIDFTTQVQKPIVALAANGRREDAKAILKELGAARASDIKQEDYPRAVELIAAATAG